MQRRFITAMIYGLLWNSVAVSQVSIRSAYNESAVEALSKIDYKKAEKLYRLAIKEAELVSVSDAAQIASILGLTQILLDTGRIDEAGQILDGALRELERRVPVSDTDKTFYSNLRETLAYRTPIHLRDNEFVEAKSNYRHWTALLEKKFDNETDFKFDIEFSRFLEDYSQLCGEDGNFSEVEEVYKRWIAVATSKSSPKPYKVAEIKLQLAQHYSETGQNPQAEKVYRELLEDRGNDDRFARQRIIDIMGKLADIYQHDGRLLEAEAVLKEQLKVAEKSESKEWSAIALEGLADVYMTQLKYSDAESLLQHSLALSAKANGEYKSSIIGVKLKIAKCHANQGNKELAEKVYEDILASLEKRFYESSNDIGLRFLLNEALASVERFYEQNDRATDVELLLKQWIDRIEQSFDSGQSLRVDVLQRLADFYQSRNRGIEAENIYKERLETGPDNSTHAQVLKYQIRLSLAMIYLQNENFESAKKEMKGLIVAESSESLLHKEHRAHLKYILAIVSEIEGDRLNGLKLEREAIGMLRDLPGGRLGGHDALREERKADNLLYQEAFRKAEVRYSNAILAALLKLRNDPMVLCRLNEKLGRTVAAQQRHREAEVYFRRAKRYAGAK